MKQVLRNEGGVALITALMTLAVVSLLGAAALTIAGGTINQTTWDRSSNQAFAIAEAGFDQAVARIRNENLEASFTAQLLNGEAEVTITQINMMMYRVRSVGAQPSLASPKARRAIQAVIIHLDPKDIFFADSAQGTLLGSTTFDGPLYVRDELRASGNSVFTTGPFFVKDDPATLNPTGDLTLEGSDQMGTVAEPVYLFVAGSYDPNFSGLHAEEVFSVVPDLTMPIINIDAMPGERASADLVLDDDGITNGTFVWPPYSGNGPMPTGVVFDQSTPDLTTGTVGDGYLKWTKATKTLVIDGKVFIDGNVTFDVMASSITYEGQGTIVANGNIAIRSEFMPADPASDWPETDAIGLVTPYEIDMTAKPGDDIYAFTYAYEKITFDKPFNFYGNATSQALVTISNPRITVQMNVDKDDMPPGMPEMDAFTTVTGWKEVQP